MSVVHGVQMTSTEPRMLLTWHDVTRWAPGWRLRAGSSLGAGRAGEADRW